MSDLTEKISSIAVAAIMMVILFFVLATFSGADPSTLSGLVAKSVELIVYLMILGVFGAILLSILKGINP